MIQRSFRPLVYGAILSLAQTAAAETPPEQVQIGAERCPAGLMLGSTDGQTMHVYEPSPDQSDDPARPITDFVSKDGRRWRLAGMDAQGAAVNRWANECWRVE